MNKADYKNWIPEWMVTGSVAGTCAFALAGAALLKFTRNKVPGYLALLGAAALGAVGSWSVFAKNRFSYTGDRKLSKQIIEGTAEYIDIPSGGVGLDVGCGSGALTIACAKRNPDANMIGIDRWGAEYSDFSKKLCEENAKAEGVDNVSFQKGDATKLDFPDESFDAVTSNYVYHNIPFADRQKLLKETLRVLKKGGCFAIHDLMGEARYGDMGKFVEELKKEGYEDVKLIETAKGRFMSEKEGKLLFLSDSCLLIGKK